jgi:hypothetical protein
MRNKKFTRPMTESNVVEMPQTNRPMFVTEIPQSKVISFDENYTSTRAFDFTQHYGQGFDEIFNAIQQIIQILLSDSTITHTSLVGYCKNLKKFSEYLKIYGSASQRELYLTDITTELMENYSHHLKRAYPNGTSAKGCYTPIKSIFVRMQQIGWLQSFRWPKNPFPHSNRKVKGQKQFSKAECVRVANALKMDINEILKKESALSGFDLVICLLGIALRSGVNPTPLLEMTTDCIKPHPFKEERRLLTLYKRRGNGTQVQSLRFSRNIKDTQSVVPDVEIIINHIIQCNPELRLEINSDLVFLLRSQGGIRGKITALTQNLLHSHIGRWVKKHQLKDDSGQDLVVNVSRFRQTFVNRTYELANGDAFIAARLANHSLQVSQKHYLKSPVDAEKNFKFMGDIRVKELLDNTNNNIKNSPISKCTQRKANDSESPCTRYYSCVRCKFMVVTKEDLYRLFSFYWHIITNRSSVGAKHWNKYFAHIPRIIDREITPKFDKSYVKEMREKARTNPHPAWINLNLEGAMR